MSQYISKIKSNNIINDSKQLFLSFCGKFNSNNSLILFLCLANNYPELIKNAEIDLIESLLNFNIDINVISILGECDANILINNLKY